MSKFVISGSSGAIASAIINQLLENPEHEIYGLDIAEPVIYSPRFHHLKTNLTNSEELQNSVNQIPENIDILIHAAGIMRRGNYLESSEADYDLIMNINFKCCISLQKFLHSKFSNKPTILYLSSRHGINLKPDPFAYSMSKFCLWGFAEMTKHMFPEWTIKIAFPGSVDTPLSWHGVKEEDKAAKFQRMITPEKIAAYLIELTNRSEPYLSFDEETREYSFTDQAIPQFHYLQ